MDMININYEPLMIEEGVKGLCLYPSSAYDKIDDYCEDLNEIYKLYGVMPEQTHSLNVGVVKRRSDRFPNTDALISFDKELPVGVRTADCVPILIYAPDVKGVAAVHAGWKGTLGGIVDNVIEEFGKHGASTEKMIMAFGPSISKEKYEVDSELAARFKDAGFEDLVIYPDGKDNKPHIDLQGINAERLKRKGVKEENIKLHTGCTFSSRNQEGLPLYQSHRRSKGKPGRNFTCIKLK